jgi:hypothetical protein
MLAHGALLKTICMSQGNNHFGLTPTQICVLNIFVASGKCSY